MPVHPSLTPECPPHLPLAGRTVLVTGGARGIGAAVCRAIAAQGAYVVCADLLEDEGYALAAELGASVVFRLLDVTDEAAWEAMTEFAANWKDGLDVLVNCAGIVVSEAIINMTRETFDKVMAVNLTGAFLGMKHAARWMKARGGGSIINFSSTEGLQGSNSMAAYASSKWAVRGITKVAALEFGPWNIRVNSVHPGPVDTPMMNPQRKSQAELQDHPMLARMALKRVAAPSEIASVCCFLAGDASSFVTGTELVADGGATIGMYLPARPGAPEI